jgi:hypothetical protein
MISFSIFKANENLRYYFFANYKKGMIVLYYHHFRIKKKSFLIDKFHFLKKKKLFSSLFPLFEMIEKRRKHYFKEFVVPF